MDIIIVSCTVISNKFLHCFSLILGFHVITPEELPVSIMAISPVFANVITNV